MNIPKIRRALKRGNQVQFAKTMSISSLVGGKEALAAVRQAVGGTYRKLREACQGAKIVPDPILRKWNVTAVKEVST
jgi:hypothetical protein